MDTEIVCGLSGYCVDGVPRLLLWISMVVSFVIAAVVAAYVVKSMQETKETASSEESEEYPGGFWTAVVAIPTAMVVGLIFFVLLGVVIELADLLISGNLLLAFFVLLFVAAVGGGLGMWIFRKWLGD